MENTEQTNDSKKNDDKNAEGSSPHSSDDEEIFDFDEFEKSCENQRKTAEMLVAREHNNACTYPEGYKPRQPLFACRTCTPEPKLAGFCYGCAVNCHDNHDIVELYTKRLFKCDCGNSKFENKCSLYEEKDPLNDYNIYNHNFNGTYCVCKSTYPSEVCDEELFQCETCEDWFHLSHIGMEKTKFVPDENTTEETSDESSVSLICPDCSEKFPFLRLMEGSETVCHSKIENNVSTKRALAVESLRERICKCADCKKVYDKLECNFLLDDADDVGKFEKENLKRMEENGSNNPPDDGDIRGLVKEFGMETTIKYLGAVNTFKRKLTDFLANFKGSVIKVEHVKEFFDKTKEEYNESRAKRPRTL